MLTSITCLLFSVCSIHAAIVPEIDSLDLQPIPTIAQQLSPVLQNTTAIEKLVFASGLATSSEIRLQSIAECESSHRQFNASGTPLLGIVNSSDIGIFQINLDLNPLKVVKDKLGFDLSTLEGNIQYAILLYKQNGTQPWSASKNCWSKIKV